MNLFARATPEPPHALRQHFAVNSRDCDTHTIHSVAPMQFGGSHSTDATQYNPHTSALAEIPPEYAATQAVLFIAPHSPAEPFTNRHWNLVAQLADAELRVEVPIARNSPLASGSEPKADNEESRSHSDSTHMGRVARIRETYLSLAETHGPERVTIIAEASYIPQLPTILRQTPTPRAIVLLAPHLQDISPLLSSAENHIHGTELHIFFAKKSKEGAEIERVASKQKEGIAIHLHEGASGDRLYHLKQSRAGRAARKVIVNVAHNTAAREV